MPAATRKAARWHLVLTLVALVAAAVAIAQQGIVDVQGPIFNNPATTAQLPFWNAAFQVNLAQTPAMPPCSVATSGVYDPDCVMQCGLFPWLSTYDGGYACVRADAGLMSITNQPNNLAIGNGPFMLADAGWQSVQTFTDDTSSSAAVLQVDDAEIRAAFGGAHTIVAIGYYRSTGPDPTGWFAMITDGVNQMQLRRGGGSNLQLLETPNVASSGGECLDNWCTIFGRNGGDGGINITQGGNQSSTVATTIAAITGTPKLFIGGGTGGCCAPGGSMGGPVAPFTLYRAYKSDTWVQVVNRGVWGAQAVASGPGGGVGDIGVRLGRYDLDKTGGSIPVLGVGDYHMDPLTGAHTNQTYHVLGPADLLDGGVLGGAAVWRGHMDQGPFYNWKHQNAAGWLTSEDAGLAWEELGSTTQAAHSVVSYNASFIGTALTDGGYAVNNQYTIQNICTGGVIDGGFVTCSGTLLGNGVFARYPFYGCPFQCSNTSGSGITVKSILYAGNDAGQTAGLEIAEILMTDSLEIEPPSVTNAQVSAQYLEIDGGALVNFPSGCQAGNVTTVFQTDYSSSNYTHDVNANSPPVTGSYLYDISNASSSHDLLAWLTGEATPETNDAGNASTMDMVMYGLDSAYITPNKFSSSGQYNGRPAQFSTGVYYVHSGTWDVETGTLPDGGFGPGSRLVESLNSCADQSKPFGCQANTIILANTGQMGLCPGTPDTFEIGTRQLGSGPSTSHVHHINICSCPGVKCQGPCQ